ncbi:hypothetical protein JXM67_10025 [candidate division WOR-3 bacterium]|nr:hypothetical protein [candidate division WOR-3 bacterium]
MPAWVKVIVLCLFASLFLGTAASSFSHADVNNIDLIVVADSQGNPGGGIKLIWDEPYVDDEGCFLCCSKPTGDGPDRYAVYVDGVRVGETEETEYTVYTPGVEIEIAAVYGVEESKGLMIDLGAVETPTLNVWTVNDPSPDHPSGFGFSVSGSAQTYSMSDEGHREDIDYWIASGFILTAPCDRYPDSINAKGSAAKMENVLFDSLLIASPPGKYCTQQPLEEDSVYSLWLDYTNDNYSLDDRFGKMQVTYKDTDGLKVTLKLAFQTENGLRWVAVK